MGSVVMYKVLSILIGSSLRLRSLTEEDFDALYAAASDPLIWEQHPDRERYTLERFKEYFRSGIECKGALVVCDLKTGRIVGSSRFTDYDSEKSFVLIGFTFLCREYWGGKYNLELKTLMLDYAFQYVESVYFVVGNRNLRSQKAMGKIGGNIVTEIKPAVAGDLVFKINKTDWIQRHKGIE